MKRKIWKRFDRFDFKLIFRTILSLPLIIMFLINQDLFKNFLFYDILFFKAYHILWLIMMIELISYFIPKFNKSMTAGKMLKRNYTPKVHDAAKRIKDTKNQNKRAMITALLWAVLIIMIGILKAVRIINANIVIVSSIFFYWSDQICINIWCPFSCFIMKSGCCNSCRIFNWGQFMMFSPLIFIPSFWTYSLFFVSLVILIMWETAMHKHPERFSKISNEALACNDCTAKCKTWYRKT